MSVDGVERVEGLSLSSKAPGEPLDAVEQVSVSFKAAMASLRRLKGRETHHPGELSYAQYGMLFGLAKDEALSTRELADAAEVSAATATQMLDGLERAGFVERIRSEHDKRVVLTSLSGRGRELVEQRRVLFEPRWRGALSEFSDEQLLTASAVLERIREIFDDFAAHPVTAEVPGERVSG